MRTIVTLAAAALAVVVLPPSAALAVTHTVEPGETLTSIAAVDGLTVAELAAANGLSPEAQLIAGSALAIPVAGSGATAAAPPSAAGESSAVAEPAAAEPSAAEPAAAAVPAAGGSLSSAQIADVAAGHGVPGSLAAAVAWQESGFNNAMVSSAGARGVMQVMPGTWQFVQDNLGTGPLDPADPLANVTAGSAYLRHLLDQSGGDPTTAIASYYQGPGSVASVGILPETQRYVDNVLALQGRFGG